MLIYNVVGWIVVVAFGITAAVTILSLVGVLRIEPQYQKRLFNTLIVEIISAGFFLFYEAYSTKGGIATDPATFYAVNAQGTPVPLVITAAKAGDTLLYVPQAPPDAFREQKLRSERSGDNLLIKSRDDSVYYGFLPDARDSLSVDLLPPALALYLGYYLSEIENGERRMPHEAVKFLLQVLRDKDATDESREKAMQKLLLVLPYIKWDEDFELLISTINHYRTQDYLRYYELAEAYLQYGKRATDAAVPHQKQALENYLRFLTTPESNDRGQETQRELAKQHSLELVVSLSPWVPEIKEREKPLTNAIRKHDEDAISEELMRLFPAALTGKNP